MDYNLKFNRFITIQIWVKEVSEPQSNTEQPLKYKEGEASHPYGWAFKMQVGIKVHRDYQAQRVHRDYWVNKWILRLIYQFKFSVETK